MALTKVGKEGIAGISNSSDATAITISSGEVVTLADDLIIKDSGTIGSASKTDAITIAASGNTQLRSTGIAAGSQLFQIIDDGTTVLNVRSEDGNINFPVAGGGVYLGVTAAASSNLLNDYEEGTWTPSVTVGTSSAAYGFYTKIGRQVFLSGRVSNFSNTTNNEVLFIQGLPFVDGSSNTVLFGTSMIEKVDKDFGYEVVLINTDDRLRFFHSTNADSDPLRHVDLDGSDSIIYFQGTYFV